ncbi:hypothetical protein SporoP8_06200 [Sporosarcina ureae]|nr:hypothetical protein SporoP8_06200 [Sporosarcina ureae]
MMKRAAFITQQKQTELPSSSIVAIPISHVTYAMKKQVAIITQFGRLVNLTRKQYFVVRAVMN